MIAADGTSALQTFISKVVAYVVEPFSTWPGIVDRLLGAVHAFADLQSKTGWLYMLSSAALAAVLYAVARRNGLQASFRSFVSPKEVYAQRSAVADYKFVSLDLSIKLLVYTPLVSGISYLAYKVFLPLTASITLDLSGVDPLLRTAALTVFAVAVADFGFFLSHYLMHRIPTLWHFHEIHHSAEVLTPVTVYRTHPVEDLVNGLVGGAIGALGAAFYTSLSGRDVGVITIFGVNAVMFAFFLFAFQLRHSHIWLSYGPWWSLIFISPAQHQIHHSVDPLHWSKNYGFVFAFWDLLFGSLYVPRQREVLQFGVPGSDPADFSTVGRLYFLPFRKAARSLLKLGMSQRSAAVTTQVGDMR